jgi:hypothetical protein
MGLGPKMMSCQWATSETSSPTLACHELLLSLPAPMTDRSQQKLRIFHAKKVWYGVDVLCNPCSLTTIFQVLQGQQILEPNQARKSGGTMLT